MSFPMHLVLDLPSTNISPSLASRADIEVSWRYQGSYGKRHIVIYTDGPCYDDQHPTRIRSMISRCHVSLALTKVYIRETIIIFSFNEYFKQQDHVILYEDSGQDASIQKESGHCQLNFNLHWLWFKLKSETLHFLYSSMWGMRRTLQFHLSLFSV